LAVPPAMLADRLAQRTEARTGAEVSEQAQAGSYFGVWNFVTKFNLALAAGISLPLVGLAGYEVGAGATAVQSAEALWALGAVYALLPALIKCVALAMLWHWRGVFEAQIERAGT
jgi:Na+/melibiose symporter-like transporter